MKMKEYKVPIQSLIDHIKTATDVDPWAKEMAEELLKEKEPMKCADCIFYDSNCQQCGNPDGIVDGIIFPDWYCADWESI